MTVIGGCSTVHRTADPPWPTTIGVVEMPDRAIRVCPNGTMEPAEEMRAAQHRGEKLHLTEDEIARVLKKSEHRRIDGWTAEPRIVHGGQASNETYSVSESQP